MKGKRSYPTQTVSYQLDPRGGFRIKDYNHQKTFSNFFPGIAGPWGIPMWVFYVNRGQCISSFGTESKDKSILEFHPANKAYQLTPLHGFRTFLKVRLGSKQYFWEPFQNHSVQSPYRLQQSMHMTAHDLTIEDVNQTLGLTVRVNYFTVPEESFPALVRHVQLINRVKQAMSVEMIDGLPCIVPFGLSDWVAKHMSRTVEAFVRVHSVEKKTPFYQLNVEVADTPRVNRIHEGHFYFSFVPGRRRQPLCDVIVERQCVYGTSSDLRTPEAFLKKSRFAFPRVQQTTNRTPAAMTYQACRLNPNGLREIISLVGYAASERALSGIVRRATTPGFIVQKRHQNQAVIDTIKNNALTRSSSAVFDQYCSQTFLDNVLRGGLPITLSTGDGQTVFNVYSRKHGDLERDYNFFLLAPTPYSQGNGNYRDVNQNRRNDVWFNPQVRENHIVDFMNLIQADGYNPLVVNGTSFVIQKKAAIQRIVAACLKKDSAVFRHMLQKGFQPGELLTFLMKEKIPLKLSPRQVFARVMAASHKQLVAQHGVGFWIDHWTYCLDLIESYLGLYPESLRDLLMGERIFYFYHNTHTVLPRDRRYIQTPEGVRQFQSVSEDEKDIQAEATGHRLRVRNGKGDIYYTHLMAKLLCLIVNKVATLDPSGIGIEMEADKPDWYDALNGLPGLLGSSLNETIELKRFCQFLLSALTTLELGEEGALPLFEELADFIRELAGVLRKDRDPLAYWHKANDFKEHFRNRTRYGIAGEELDMSVRDIREFLQLVLHRTDAALERAKTKDGLLDSYFYHEVKEFHIETTAEGQEVVRPKAFQLHRLPLFLEGFVHALRVTPDSARARKLYRRLRRSPLFDRKLKMYKVNADLSDETLQIGRSRIFPRGWLENESIWIHMEYKYLLELLRCGLYREFFETFRDVLVPFQDAQRYGRSLLENSSFIVSSAHSDPALHGRGFVARTSGSTAEFVHIWLWMNTGLNPFSWSRKQKLTLTLSPILAGSMFSREPQEIAYWDSKSKRQTARLPRHTYAFVFLGSILVVYHNPKHRDTFQDLPIKEIILRYPNRKKTIRIQAETIPPPYARDVRDRKIARIDIFF